MKMTYLLVVACAALTCSPVHATDENCKEIKDESPATLASLARYNTFLSKVQGSVKEQSAFKAVAPLKGNIKWTCNPVHADAKECCESIPVNLLLDPDKPCIVFLSYTELEISTAKGTLKPTIIWKLRPVFGGDVSGFIFDEQAGIVVRKISMGKPLPVGQGGYYSVPQDFQLTSNGHVGDRAKHWPLVFPLDKEGNLGEACTFYDPLIINTD